MNKCRPLLLWTSRMPIRARICKFISGQSINIKVHVLFIFFLRAMTYEQLAWGCVDCCPITLWGSITWRFEVN